MEQVTAIAETFYAAPVREQLIAAARQAGYGEQNQRFTCVASVGHAEIARALAPSLFEALGTPQLRKVAAFLETPAGAYYHWRGKPGAVRVHLPAPPRPAYDDQTLLAFVNSEAGAALVSPLRPVAVQRAADTLEAQTLSQCASNPPPQPTDRVLLSLKELACTPPRPFYPADARRRSQSGTVRVWLLVSKQGRVELTAVSRSSGVPSLDAAAEAAVQAMNCKIFRTADGKPVSVTATQPIGFELN
ncbi:energy transducer TonB [Cupriavidus sp. 8B]